MLATGATQEQLATPTVTSTPNHGHLSHESLVSRSNQPSCGDEVALQWILATVAIDQKVQSSDMLLIEWFL